MTPHICIIKNDIPIGSAAFQFLLQFVAPEKAERILRQKVKQNADNMLVGAVLAQYMLLKTFHIPFSAQYISCGPHGKPYLRDHPDAHFNISHSGRFVACAVSHRPIGVDIQQIRPYRSNMVKRVCTPEELLRIEASPDPSAEFTKLWTQKEAYLKMLGTGFSQGIQSLEIPLSKIHTFPYQDTFVSILEE